jgi:hypothetical protein
MTRFENTSQIPSGAAKTTRESATTRPAERTPSPATPGRKERSASGPPIEAIANPSRR